MGSKHKNKEFILTEKVISYKEYVVEAKSPEEALKKFKKDSSCGTEIGDNYDEDESEVVDVKPK